jgi:hypothetical protein
MSWGSTLIHQEALVLCVDEKSRIQALDRTQPGLPIKKERFGSMTHDYKRNGTTTLFAALETLQGKVVGECHQRHPDQEFSEIPATTRQRVSGRYLAASDHGQLRHPQACESDRVAQASPTVCASFCSHQFQLDESRRALVRSLDIKQSSAACSSASLISRHPSLPFSVPGMKVPGHSSGPQLSSRFRKNSPAAAERWSRPNPGARPRSAETGRKWLSGYFSDTTLHCTD